MRRKYKVMIIFWAIVSAIGFIMIALGSSTIAYFGVVLGIIGATGSWLGLLLDRQDRIIVILEEIRESLTRGFED